MCSSFPDGNLNRDEMHSIASTAPGRRPQRAVPDVGGVSVATTGDFAAACAAIDAPANRTTLAKTVENLRDAMLALLE